MSVFNIPLFKSLTSHAPTSLVLTRHLRKPSPPQNPIDASITTPKVPLDMISPPQSFSDLESYVDTESEATPGASISGTLVGHASDVGSTPNLRESDISSRTNPLITHSRPPPPRDPPRTDDAPINYYDDDLDREEIRLRESRSGRVPRSQDEESGFSTPTSQAYRRHRRHFWEDMNWDDMSWNDRIRCISIWVLFCVSALAISGATAIIWVLVVQ
ncbi:hypothetical protein HBI70_070660 [Parastagonospora nodorum]|nr:hypothetical protein HBH53_099390 [Parastagonospora nodorum]KAH4259027.1 hypothetical protein HBI03_141390 [Parastagonospora nodorum]KAH4276388.1 hypothetical protein HBI04_108030 [Parastagonospora nodorum]KAH4608789.1 hypothetical protein HBH82_073320 [Parastagonospora nodorum]KAH4689334.1 hypothetical protein HBH78_093340 [Parastagonospora nodorum]